MSATLQRAARVLADVMAAIQTTDPDSATFLDSGADSWDLVHQLTPEITAALAQCLAQINADRTGGAK